ncbi:MAG: hypothetical protein ACREQY_01735, partial [Candidatus Binatia bacterium]
MAAMRRRNAAAIGGGGERDALPARGRLGTQAKAAIETGAVKLLAPYRVVEVGETAGGRLRVRGELDGAA